MGGICSADQYIQVKEKYGTQLSKYIVGERMKLFIRSTTEELQTKINQKSIVIETQALRSIKAKEDELETCFIKAKQDLHESKSESTVAHNQKLQQALGYTYFEGKLKDLKEQIFARFKSEERVMKSELDEIRQTEQELINQQRPHMIIFNEMKPQEQKQIIKRGQEEYRTLIKGHEESLRKKYGVRLKEDYYISRFQEILNEESLRNLIVVAKDKFKTSASLLISKN